MNSSYSQWKESCKEDRVGVDDLVSVDLNSPRFSVSRDDDIESVFEYYEHCRENLTTTDHELVDQHLHSVQLEGETLETRAGDLDKRTLSTDCHSLRHTSTTSAFSEHSHYVRYPLDYNILLDSNQTEEPNTYMLTAV